jgi:branched-chain amino acid transport system substrate-binding protein
MQRAQLLKMIAAIIFGSSSAAIAEEVVIGAQFPLSGPMASYSGPRLQVGSELAVDRINSSGMLGQGRSLKLLIEDNAGEKAQAISLMSRFITANEVTGVFGVFGSTLSVPVAPIANEGKTPFLAIAASDAIVKAGPWSFMILSPAEKEVAASGRLAIDKLHVKSMAIVFDRTNDSSTRMKNALEAYLKERHVDVVSIDGIGPQDTNFQPLGTKLSRETIDALYVESPPPIAANFFIQLREAGIGPDVHLLASPNVNSPVFYEIGGKAVEGVYFPSIYQADSPSAENKAFVEAYRKRVQADPDLTAAMAFSGMMLFGHAVKAAGPNADRDSVRDALGKLRDIPSVLGNGVFSFDKDRYATYEDVMVRIKNGKPEIVRMD